MYTVQHIEAGQDTVGWGIWLRHTCDSSDFPRGFVGCRTPEDAIRLFLAESPGFSEEDILRVAPIFDARLTRELLAVSSGDYSDYEVWAVFDDKEKANQYRDQLALVEYNVKIETLPLNPPLPDIVRYIEVWMDRHGDTKPIRPAKYIRVSELGFYGYNYHESDPILIWRVRAEEPERAIKVVNEVRAQLVAADIWGDSMKTRDWAKTRARR